MRQIQEKCQSVKESDIGDKHKGSYFESRSAYLYIFWPSRVDLSPSKHLRHKIISQNTLGVLDLSVLFEPF